MFSNASLVQVSAYQEPVELFAVSGFPQGSFEI
jgi:hypothetical protein